MIGELPGTDVYVIGGGARPLSVIDVEQSSGKAVTWYSCSNVIGVCPVGVIVH